MNKISVLVYFDTKEELQIKRCIDSIVQNSRSISAQVQVILLDPDKDGSCAQKIPTSDRLTVTEPDVAQMEAPEAYNTGLAEADGEYVSFLLTSSFWGRGALKALVQRAEKNGDKLLSLCPMYYRTEGKAKLYRVTPEEGGEKDASSVPEDIQLVLQAYLIERHLLDGLSFWENLHEDAFCEMVLELLLKNNGKFYYAQKQEYFYTVVLENNGPVCPLAEQRWWYEDSVRNFLLEFMQRKSKERDGNVPRYVQRIVYYLMCVKFYSNLAGRDKLLLNREDVKQFYDLCFELLTYIENDIIFQREKFCGIQMPRLLCVVFIRGKAAKAGYESKISEEKGVLTCSMISPENGDVVSQLCIGSLDEERFEINVINYKDGKIEIDGFYKIAVYLEPGSFEFYGELGGDHPKRVTVEKSDNYNLLKCFDVTYGRKYAVHAEVSVEDLLASEKGLSFYIKTKDYKKQLEYRFARVSSRLLTYSQKAYWRFDHDKYMLTRRNNSLTVTRSSALLTFKHELLLLMVLLIQKGRWKAIRGVGMRLLYWLTRPYYKRKRIWMTFDKLFKAGDNGEYCFQYCRKQQKEIDCYYVINKDAVDCARLKKEHPGKIVYANSLRSRLLALHSEAILATHAGATKYLGFKAWMHKYIKDIYQADNVCIQHGLSIQKIAHFQNKWYANTKLYCCASPYELENVAKPIYGYEPEALKMTGLARYDGLKNREQKQILITPTWRKGLVHTKGVGMKNEHSDLFKETAYYRIYNSLINDEQLISCAKELGYRIIFLLHPAMSAQLEDYEQNGFVELLQATGDTSYEKLLTESSLMVTDYSGVQFDFAYQRKPIVYYHPSELPPHYTEGGLIYDTMGFGPICTEHGQIIETLCSYMRSGCQMETEYRQRADHFFAYDDFNNCERIYQAVLQFKNER